MPNVWTHILFGEKVAKAAGLEVFARDYKPFYQLGTQGPDPFFYHNFFPWQSKPVGVIGSKIHYEKCGSFLSKMIQYGLLNKDRKLQAYIAGFVTHHLLDRHTHPYINYRSGNEGNRHQRLEIIIDTLLMKRWKNIDTYKMQVHKEIYVGKTLYDPISHMLTELIEDTFPTEAREMPAGYVNQSYQHMVRALQILHDPYGWKNRLLKNKVSPFSYQKYVDEKDYLNEKETRWLHPTDEQEASVESFLTLFEKAEKEGYQILSLIKEYWTTGENQLLSQLEEKIGNISYDTGKDCSLGLENKYFEPIL
ncbi:zinc dependent phospholipase C family protein [Bacillus suaedaesalsae]|uniref:Zinc dependent phospholipase C family protein n=1 Tax=Bacillus suaedaesalsae TaxID=2810349 RepID=A0ABS2DED9_9BACI|nr:zinc dependent phospholipase C family protein [Bacillus suaedaesalsae]MBM6616834.1 zinc dependent phospholipase C family protein [Bacillus suaedaesalsae]